MKRKYLTILILFSIPFSSCLSQEENQLHTVNNPVNTNWIKSNLNKSTPRIMLTPTILKGIKKAASRDEFVKDYVSYLEQQCDDILNRSILSKKMQGKRMLETSREALKRMGILALTYRITDNEKYLNRLEKELSAVSDFNDWNPQHFLDVGEMALAVSIGMDWAGPKLSASVKQKAIKALMDKALLPSIIGNKNWWIKSNNNWNQVCHGGLTAAAIAIAQQNPDLAAQVISRSIEKIPLALKSYAADGAYPEGPSYWGYGTTYSIYTFSMLKTAFGTDFGLSNAPGFKESCLYRIMTVAPSGKYFNYSDTRREHALNFMAYETLSWFMKEKGKPVYIDKSTIHEALKYDIKRKKRANGLLAPALTWLWDYPKEANKSLPNFYMSKGTNPIAVIQPNSNEKSKFFLGVKGGSASSNHGHMDAGSFVFELNGVRWSIDLGQQNYYQIERAIGGGLWSNKQESKRWSVLAHNNYGHSTMTVNESLHKVEGFAPIQTNGSSAGVPIINVDMGRIFSGQLSGAKRTFKKQNSNTLIIEDNLRLNRDTKTFTWSMITEAEINLSGNEASLYQNGKTLNLKILSPAGAMFSLTSLNPPPKPYDVKNPKLNRLDIRINARDCPLMRSLIKVELQGQ